VPIFPADDPRRALNNVNRLITSTKNGLHAAARPYAIKMRTDMVLTGTGFLGYFRRYTARCEAWKILRERVVSSTVYARNPRRFPPFPFHPSDMFFFGCHEDVLDIWDIPLAPEPETARWFETRPRPVPESDEGALSRYVPEQYIWLTFLHKYGDVVFDHKSDLSGDAINISELTIANNLALIEPSKLNVEFLKFPLSRANWLSLYSHGEWLRMYKKYCDPQAFCPPDATRWQKRILRVASNMYHSLVAMLNRRA